MKQLINTSILLLLFTSNSVSAQDTVKYSGFLRGFLLYETIELYPDSTFKWTSEYDLNWSQYGSYEVKASTLTLKYNPEKSSQTEVFEMDGTFLYRLKENGHRIKKVKDRSIKKKGFGNRHPYEIKKVNG